MWWWPRKGTQVADPLRIDEPRRRVEDDPASVPFAQLTEDCRRMSQLAQLAELETWLAALLADRASGR